MKWTGKILGFIIGWFTGGPLLATLGLIIGHVFDKGFSFSALTQTPEQQKKTQHVFFKSVFLFMGYIAKSDGRVSEEEIIQARAIMNRMGLNRQQKRDAIQFFTQGKQPHFNFEAALETFYNTCHPYKDLLRLFIEIQFQAANVKGRISSEKRKILRYLSQYVGFTPIDFSAFDQFFRAHQRYQSYQSHQEQPHTPHKPIQNAYQILGLSHTATDAEIKKTYRRLMSENHPDKLIAKGLPESMIKIATEKTQEIKSAYDQICKARGIR